MDRKIAKKIDDIVMARGRVLICAHRDPDGDSIGCQLAFYEYLRKRRSGLVVANHGELPRKYQFLDPRGVVKQPGQVKPGRWGAAVVFECSNLDRVGDIKKLLRPDTPIVNIDHHVGNSAFGVVNWIDGAASACGEMVYDLIRAMRGEITPRIAELLLTTILTDTGRFHYKSTQPDTLRTVADLMDAGADLKKLTDRLFFCYTEPQFRFINYIMARADILEDGKICLLKIRQRDLKKFNVLYRDLEGLVDTTLTLAGVKIGALLREMEGGWTKISLRSTGQLSIVPLARRFCGGGHRNAAGCQIDKPLNQAVKELAQTATRYLRDRH